MTRILVVEDHQMVADGIVLGLGVEGWDARAADGDPDRVAAAIEDFAPDLVLLDLHLGRGRLGTDLLPTIGAGDRIVAILTSETRPEVLAPALRAGAATVLDKSLPFPALVEEIRNLIEGGEAGPGRRETILAAARTAEQDRVRRLAPFELLTPREKAVLGDLMEGHQAAEIAELSYVSLATVRSQIRSILLKLGVNSQLSAVTMAIKAGWSPPDRDH